MGGVGVGRMLFKCHVNTCAPLQNIYSPMGSSHGGTYRQWCHVVCGVCMHRHIRHGHSCGQTGVMCYSICMHENMTCWTAQISQSSEEDAVHWTCDMSTYGHLRVKHVCSTYYSNAGSDRGYSNDDTVYSHRIHTK
jgi:hypothetical protein